MLKVVTGQDCCRDFFWRLCLSSLDTCAGTCDNHRKEKNILDFLGLVWGFPVSLLCANNLASTAGVQALLEQKHWCLSLRLDIPEKISGCKDLAFSC